MVRAALAGISQRTGCTALTSASSAQSSTRSTRARSPAAGAEGGACGDGAAHRHARILGFWPGQIAARREQKAEREQPEREPVERAPWGARHLERRAEERGHEAAERQAGAERHAWLIR